MSLSANWIKRGPPSPRGFPAATSAVLAIVPNPELLKVAFGRAKFGWLKMLKNSERNCRFMRSRICVVFSTEKSAELVREPMMELRPALPKVPGAGATKAVVLNQASRRLGPSLGLPITSGRSLLVSPLPLGAVPFQKGVIGRPLASV